MTQAARVTDAATDSRGEKPSDEEHFFPGDRARRKYFRVLRSVLQFGFLIAYLIPITIITVYFYYTFNRFFHESVVLQMSAVAESQRNTIALQVQTRVVNIFNLFHSEEFNLVPGQHEMDLYLEGLVVTDSDFVDIGFIDPEGVQIGYAGPYQHLLNKNYSQEDWYMELIGSDKSYVVTDLYLGLRDIPHFTIGVKQIINGQYYVIRTSLNPETLQAFLTTTNNGEQVDGFLINREGLYQVVAREFGELLKPAAFVPPINTGTHVTEVVLGGKRVLVAYTWLNEVPWCLIMMQPNAVAFKAVESVRNRMIFGSAALVLVLMTVIWIIVKRIIRWTESLEHDRADLKTQLYHAQKVVAVGQLASGVAHEINNPLAIISSESGLIRDMLDEQLGMECTPAAIIKELDEIDEAVHRAKMITQKILGFVRRAEPRLELCKVDRLLDEVVEGVKERQLNISNIALVRDYAPDIPELMLDPDLMRQVFLNLVNNASDAVTDGCTITLRVRYDSEWIRITVADDGVGMSPEQLQKAFMPFFTTKDVGKGTGLGLSISQNIVEGFGGRIEVESALGVGSAFTIVLPVGSDAVGGDKAGSVNVGYETNQTQEEGAER